MQAYAKPKAKRKVPPKEEDRSTKSSRQKAKLGRMSGASRPPRRITRGFSASPASRGAEPGMDLRAFTPSPATAWPQEIHAAASTPSRNPAPNRRRAGRTSPIAKSAASPNRWRRTCRRVAPPIPKASHIRWKEQRCRCRVPSRGKVSQGHQPGAPGHIDMTRQTAPQRCTKDNSGMASMNMGPLMVMSGADELRGAPVKHKLCRWARWFRK